MSATTKYDLIEVLARKKRAVENAAWEIHTLQQDIANATEKLPVELYSNVDIVRCGNSISLLDAAAYQAKHLIWCGETASEVPDQEDVKHTLIKMTKTKVEYLEAVVDDIKSLQLKLAELTNIKALPDDIVYAINKIDETDSLIWLQKHMCEAKEILDAHHTADAQ